MTSLILSTMRLRYVPLLTSWQGQRASNPQPSVLETDALPIELCPCCALFDDLRHDAGADGLAALADAKRSPCSMAIGVISVTTIFTLSPGITISVPLGSSTAPVTSVVR